MIGCKSSVLSKTIPSIFLTKNHLPLHKGGYVTDFWGCYLLPKFDVNKLFDNPSDGYRRQLPLHSEAQVDVKLKDIYLQP